MTRLEILTAATVALPILLSTAAAVISLATIRQTRRNTTRLRELHARRISPHPWGTHCPVCGTRIAMLVRIDPNDPWRLDPCNHRAWQDQTTGVLTPADPPRRTEP